MDLARWNRIVAFARTGHTPTLTPEEFRGLVKDGLRVRAIESEDAGREKRRLMEEIVSEVPLDRKPEVLSLVLLLMKVCSEGGAKG